VLALKFGLALYLAFSRSHARRGHTPFLPAAHLYRGGTLAKLDTWTKVKAVLKMTYGRLATTDALNSLYSNLNDLADAALLAAIERHISDTTSETNGLAGSWFPKPAQVRLHANTLQVEAEAIRVQGLEARQRELEVETVSRVVEFPEGSTFGLSKDVTVIKTICHKCRDSGLAAYYTPKDRSNPASKYRLYLAEEFYTLPATTRNHFSEYSAVCDCAAGMIRRDKHPDLHREEKRNGGRAYRVYITVELAEQIAAKRRAKEAGSIGAAHG
jgi:hypothetical protein